MKWIDRIYLHILDYREFLELDSYSPSLPAQSANTGECKCIAIPFEPSTHALQTEISKMIYLNRKFFLNLLEKNLFSQIKIDRKEHFSRNVNLTFAHRIHNIENIHIITDLDQL